MKQNQNNQKNKNCGSKNCGNKNCKNKSNAQEESHSYSHGGNND